MSNTKEQGSGASRSGMRGDAASAIAGVTKNLRRMVNRAKDWLKPIPPEYICAVDSSFQHLEDKADERLIERELSYILAGKPNGEHIRRLLQGLKASSAQDDFSSPVAGAYTVGLAFSGGGIRSATFCLGVLQRFASADALKDVDYLSTVSGGGYIGCALAWWLADRTSQSGGRLNANLGENFPYGTEDPKASATDKTKILTYLRENGNYLIPGNGVTVWSGIVVVLRSILLNLLVWIPITAALFIVLYPINCGAVRVMQIIVIRLQNLFGVTRDLDLASFASGACNNTENPTIFFSLLVFFVLLAIVFVVSSVDHSLLAWAPRWAATRGRSTVEHERVAPKHAVDLSAHREDGVRPVESKTGLLRQPWRWLIACVFVALYLGAMMVAYYVGADSIGILFHDVSADAVAAAIMQPGWWLSMVAFFAAVLLALIFNFLIAQLWRQNWRTEKISLAYSGRRFFEKVFGYLLIPAILLLAIATVPAVDKLLNDKYGLEGIVSVIMGAGGALWGHVQMRGKDGGGRVTELVLILGSILFVYGILLLGYHVSGIYLGTSETVRAALAATFVVSLVSGWFTNLNDISLHRYYRDRLMEAFMPDYETVEEGKVCPALLADDWRLSSAWKEVKGPFPIINTNVVLVKSTVRKYLSRGGDNFILTPCYSGSNATGWRLTKSFVNDEITVPTAMAISGAAANPRTGAGGKGVTTNRVVSLVMTLLNFRLGYWVVNPKPRTGSPMRPNHFYPAGWYSLGFAGYNEHAHYLELSDGGHFENLALYELIRRRCGIIVVCDGGQDFFASYQDFITAIRRVEQDFGARITPIEGCGAELLVPRLRADAYPRGADYARQGYFVATIDYGERGAKRPWPKIGILIYLKASMIDALSFKAKGYKGAHPQFPDESTLDQFFDEEQFEAYREVGYRIASEMVDDLALSKILEQRPELNEVLIQTIIKAACKAAESRKT
jgi:hypothetical protein